MCFKTIKGDNFVGRQAARVVALFPANKQLLVAA